MLEFMYNPEELKKIYNAFLISSAEADEAEKAFLEKYQEYLTIKDNGFTVYSKTKSGIELSKGCQACKNGKWLCVFVGYHCNMNCPFCPQPKTPNYLNVCEEKDLTSHGTIKEVQYYLSMDKNLEGISYSGGEPLLYLDKVIAIGSFVKEKRSELYQWIYTNGALIDEEKLKKLQSVGIDEIRFDLAATRFSKEVIDKIPLAKKYIKKVTVEIPAVPEIRVLMKDNLLDNIVSMGVEQLNIAEMNLLQDINMRCYANNNILVAHKGFYKVMSLFESMKIYYEILDYVVNKDLDILVNHCNFGAKFIQQINKQYNQPIFKS